MRITGIRLQRLTVPLDPPFPAAWDPVPRTAFAVTIVRVETDEGVVGIGSGDTMDGFAAFEHLLSRRPTGAEARACVAFLAPGDGDQDADPARRRAGLVRALLNHNDFIAIR